MSPNVPLHSPIGSDELFNAETGELIYSAKKTIYKDSTFEWIKDEIYADYEYRKLSNQRKLLQIVDSFIASVGEIKINTPPDPSPDFLPNAYYRPAPDDLSKYSNFEDYIQKNSNRFNF